MFSNSFLFVVIYKRNTQWILGMLLDFRKTEHTRLVARIFLRFSQVSQHPACLDHSIQTRESIWYFLNNADAIETLRFVFCRDYDPPTDKPHFTSHAIKATLDYLTGCHGGSNTLVSILCRNKVFMLFSLIVAVAVGSVGVVCCCCCFFCGNGL